jgi:endoglucanase
MKKICLLVAMVLSAAMITQSVPTSAQAVTQSVSLRSQDHGPIPARQGGYLLPGGYFTTRGAQIVDRKGIPVRIASVGWYGLEGNSALRGLDSINYKKTMDAIVADGFNTIRIPWCDILLQQSPAPGRINYELNPDLKDLTSIQVLDKIVDYAGVLGLRIILDHHTDDGGGGQQPNGLWFDKGPGTDGTDGAGNVGTVTAARFQSDTLALAARYKNNPTVIGFDLDNEPLSHGKDGVSLNWGQGGPTDIWQMYTTVGNALFKLNKHWLIICEGPQSYSNTGNGIAGVGPEADLSPVGGIDGVPAKPVVLIHKHQVVYSVHEYGTAIDDFKANEHPATLIAHMNRDWGYLYTKNIAPVWVGELGSSLDTPEERTWAQTVVDYLNGKDGAQDGPVFTGNQQPVSSSWWVWGYLPGEAPDGTLESDWVTPKPSQQAITDQLLYRPKSQ